MKENFGGIQRSVAAKTMMDDVFNYTDKTVIGQGYILPNLP